MWTARTSKTKLAIDIEQDVPVHAGAIEFCVADRNKTLIFVYCRQAECEISVPEHGSYIITRTENHPNRQQVDKKRVYVEAPPKKKKRKPKKKVDDE